MEKGQLCAVSGVRHNQIDGLWEKVVPLVTRALEHSRGEHTVEDIAKYLEERLMQLWVAHDEFQRIEACAVTQLILYPQRKMLRIVIMAGEEFSRWKTGLELLEHWARTHGCDGIEAWTRPGMVKITKELGLRSYYTLLGKDLLPIDVH